MEGPELQRPRVDDEAVFKEFGLEGGYILADNIPAIPLPPDGENDRMLWGIKAGSHYAPESHPYPHLLVIRHGSGTFSLNGQAVKYKTGDKFQVDGNAPHGFVQVDDTTVVLQSRPKNLRIRRPSAS